MLSLHTSPTDQPGTGDSGGMNVYVREVAAGLAAQGVRVDVFTRCNGRGGPTVTELADRSRIIQVHAGPCAPVPKEDLPALLPAFLSGMLGRQLRDGLPYDVVHSHYWLSGWVGKGAKEIWGIPLVASFHTLGKVKNASAPIGEDREPRSRVSGERGVVERADAILAPTPAEAANLIRMYGADPERIRVVPGGVDHEVFFPRDPKAARRRLHLTASRLALFVGRLQPHKGPDLAIRAVAEAHRLAPDLTRDLVLAVVGGPSGRGGEADEVSSLMQLAAESGLADRVIFFPPQTQERLADFYSAADVALVPSRSESFGLVALEAQASGTPVVGTATGGLPYVVRDGVTGFLVEGQEPGQYADHLLHLLAHPREARRMGRAAVAQALRFSWDATTADVLSVYREVVGGAERSPRAFAR